MKAPLSATLSQYHITFFNGDIQINPMSGLWTRCLFDTISARTSCIYVHRWAKEVVSFFVYWRICIPIYIRVGEPSRCHHLILERWFKATLYIVAPQVVSSVFVWLPLRSLSWRGLLFTLLVIRPQKLSLIWMQINKSVVEWHNTVTPYILLIQSCLL